MSYVYNIHKHFLRKKLCRYLGKFFCSSFHLYQQQWGKFRSCTFLLISQNTSVIVPRYFWSITSNFPSLVKAEVDQTKEKEKQFQIFEGHNSLEEQTQSPRELFLLT